MIGRSGPEPGCGKSVTRCTPTVARSPDHEPPERSRPIIAQDSAGAIASSYVEARNLPWISEWRGWWWSGVRPVLVVELLELA